MSHPMIAWIVNYVDLLINRYHSNDSAPVSRFNLKVFRMFGYACWAAGTALNHIPNANPALCLPSSDTIHRSSEELGRSMGIDDDELEEFRRHEQSSTVAAKREAAEKRRQIKIFSAKAKRIKKANDARAYGELLREARIREDSQQWKDAWTTSTGDFDLLNSLDPGLALFFG